MKNWWPPGHVIGYEHEFVHGIVDFIDAIATDKVIEPNFADGIKVMEVLDAGLQSAAIGQRLPVPLALVERQD